MFCAIVPARPSPIASWVTWTALCVEAAGGEQLEHALAQQVDRADLAIEALADDLDDLVELALRVAARGHHLVQLGEDRAGGGGGGHRRSPIA